MKKLIAFGVLVVLMSLWFIFSPKDEVLTWSNTDEEPPEAVFYYIGERTIRYLPGAVYTITFDPNCTFEISPEPNEPERKPFLIASEKFHNELVAEYEQLKVELAEPEPNEPKCEHEFYYGCLVYGCECYKTCIKCDKVIEPKTQLEQIIDEIPIWPDYIELEKVLIIEAPGNNKWKQGYPKGTKIYFKGETK